MKAFSTVVFILAGLLLLAGIGFFGYQFYRKLNAPAESPFKAVPQNTALIISLNKPATFWQETTKSSRPWSDLFTIPFLGNLKSRVSRLDSLIATHPQIGKFLKDHPLLITVSSTVPDEYGLLYLINFTEPDPDDRIAEFLEKTFSSGITIAKKSYGGSTITHVIMKNTGEGFFFSNKSGVFMASGYETLINQAIDRLSLNMTDPDDLSFSRVMKRSGKNVDANVFVNYHNIAGLVAGSTIRGKLSEYLNVSAFAAWSGMDVIQKNDGWLISGYSVCDDTLSQYLSLFAGQEPQGMTLQGVIPDDAASVTWIGLGNPGLYHERLLASKSATSIYLTSYPELIGIESGNQIRLSDFFIPWMGSEMGAVISKNPETLLPGEMYALFRVNDRNLADSLLRSLGNLSGVKMQGQAYKGNQVFSLGIPSVIPAIWGNLFHRLRGSCFTILSDYVIFGNTVQSVTHLIDKISAGEVIEKDPGFAGFRDNLPAGSNLCFYYNIAGAFSELRTCLSDEINREIAPAADTLKKFRSFGVQVINNGEDYLTNVFIQHTLPVRATTGPLVWQTALENPVAGKPRFITLDRSGTLGVLACDNANLLYLLDGSGKIRWKLKMPGKPLGDICEIRSPTGDSTLFAFNTEESVCIVDMNGSFTGGSPFRLPLKAITPLTCPAGSSSLYLQLADKRIHAFDLKGKPLKGWEKPALPEPALRPVQSLILKGKELLILTAKNGQSFISDKNGKQVIRTGGKTLFSPLSLFYQNKTNNKGDLLTSGTDGKLIYLRNDGKTSDLKFNNFSPNHLFFYADINSDKIQEFIYFDMNKLYCYNRFQKLLFDYTFTTPVMEPFMATCPTGEFILGTVAPKTGEIFLFGKKGRITVDPSVTGNTLFDLMKMNKNAGMNLVTGAGNTVRCYLLPQ